MPETRLPLINDPLLARLDRLAQRQRSMPPRAGSTPPPPPPPLPAPAAGTAGVRIKRRHPARSARMGALAVSCATTGGLSFLFATSGTSAAGAGGTTIQTVAPASGAAAAAAPVTTGAAPAATATTATPALPAATASTAAPTTAVPTTVAAASSQPLSFDGSVVNTRYGPVQVQIQVTNGALTDVAVVQYPDADRKSVRINEQALPTLRSEALTAQSARVDTVSGATYTSDGYAQSLQSAIDAAAAAGITVIG